jgi:hypothetical protein
VRDSQRNARHHPRGALVAAKQWNFKMSAHWNRSWLPVGLCFALSSYGQLVYKTTTLALIDGPYAVAIADF